MDSYDIGDLVIIKTISSWVDLRDEDEGKIGIIVGIYYDWALRVDILYIEIDGRRKGFYFQEVELLCKNES